MLATIFIILQRLLHLGNQQHIVNVLATVARLCANLLTIGDVLRHGVTVEPHLALHRVKIGLEP